MKLNREMKDYVNEYKERVSEINQHLEIVADFRRYGVGEVYYTDGLDIYIKNYTGSDVPEWTVQFYVLTDCEESFITNEEIIGMLRAPEPEREMPKEKLCDCGHYSAHPMMASNGTACPDCYDDMS